MSILIISGTNRPGSNALRVSNIIHGMYAALGVTSRVYSLIDLPPEAFLPEVYAEKPDSVKAIQQDVLDARGLHVITPEYNGSFPGVLKHWVDLLKFPESFEQKPVAFTGEAAGQWGALRSVEQLQLIFGYRNAHVFPQRVFIPQVHQKLSDTGDLTDNDIKRMLEKQCSGFAKFVDTLQR